MGVFVSFAEEDERFAQSLGAALTKNRIHVFIDRWHIAVGDNLGEIIHNELQEADYICCVLSKKSCQVIQNKEERWFYKEFQLALKREQYEHRTIILPIIIEPCEIPQELNGRLYANFVGKDFQKVIHDLMTPLVKLVNNKGGRFETKREFLTDFGMDYMINRDTELLQISLDFIEYSRVFDWSILTQISIRSNKEATSHFINRAKNNLHDIFLYTIITICAERFSDSSELSVLISSDKPQSIDIVIEDPKLKFRFDVIVKSKKLGQDLGFDHVIHCGNYFNMVLETAKPSTLWNES
jgi:hypothetical protein